MLDCKSNCVGWGLCVGLVLLASGCVQPLGKEDDLAGDVESGLVVPQTWGTAVETGVPMGWEASFEGAGIGEYVAEALGANFSLEAARARLEEAAALARAEGAELWPSVSASGSARRAMSNNGSEPVVRQRSDAFGASVAVSWELDIWGRVRSSTRAAEYDFASAEADFEAVRLLLTSRVIEALFTVIERERQLALSEEALRSFESNLSIVEERFRRGLNPALDLRLSRANVASARSSYALNQRLTDAARRQFEILLGRYPSGTITVAERLPGLRSGVRAGVPAQVLERRPDVRAAQSRLKASNARLRASELALLPSITLTGSYGRSSTDLDNLLKDSFDVWNLLGGVSAPLFQGGRLRANISRSEARFAQAAANYGDVLLTAFREVEAALSAETYLQEQLSALETSAEESTRALELAEERYGRGLVDIITVLEAQRRAFSSRSAVLSAQKALLSNRLTLHLALGGAFD